MTSLTSQQERKQRLIHNICRFVRKTCGIVFLLIITFSHILFQLNGLFSAVLVVILFICMVLIIISFQVPLFLKLTDHFETPEYKLPHKTKKARELYLLVSGIFVLALWVILPDLWKISFLGTVIVLLFFVVMYALFLIGFSWNSVILYEDHLSYSQYWKPDNIAYKDITDVSITSSINFWFYQYYVGYKRTSIITIKTHDRRKTPITINLDSFSNFDLIIILNVIHKSAPQASINELAEQMRNGYFPVA